MIPFDIHNKTRRAISKWMSLRQFRKHVNKRLRIIVRKRLNGYMQRWRSRAGFLGGLKLMHFVSAFSECSFNMKRGYKMLVRNTYHRSLSRRLSYMGHCHHSLHIVTKAMDNLKSILSFENTLRKQRAASVIMYQMAFRRFQRNMRCILWTRFMNNHANRFVASRVYGTLKYWVHLMSFHRVSAWVGDSKWKDQWLSRWKRKCEWRKCGKIVLARSIESYKRIRVKSVFRIMLISLRQKKNKRRFDVQLIGNRMICQWITWMAMRRGPRVAHKYAIRNFKNKKCRSAFHLMQNYTKKTRQLRNNFLVFRLMFPNLSSKYHHIQAFRVIRDRKRPSEIVLDPSEVLVMLSNCFHGLLQTYLHGIRNWDDFYYKMEGLIAGNVSLFSRCVQSTLNATVDGTHGNYLSSRKKFRLYSSTYYVSKCFLAWKYGQDCFLSRSNKLTLVGKSPNHHKSSASLLTKFQLVKEWFASRILLSTFRAWIATRAERKAKKQLAITYLIEKNVMRQVFHRLVQHARFKREREHICASHIIALRGGNQTPTRTGEIARFIQLRPEMLWGRSRSIADMNEISSINSLNHENSPGGCINFADNADHVDVGGDLSAPFVSPQVKPLSGQPVEGTGNGLRTPAQLYSTPLKQKSTSTGLRRKLIHGVRFASAGDARITDKSSARKSTPPALPCELSGTPCRKDVPKHTFLERSIYESFGEDKSEENCTEVSINAKLVSATASTPIDKLKFTLDRPPSCKPTSYYSAYVARERSPSPPPPPEAIGDVNYSILPQSQF